MRDDPVQSPLAAELVNGLSSESPGFVSREVLVELFWVLERRFRLPKVQIASLLKTILHLDIWQIETPERVISALLRYERGGAGFADQMIRLAGLSEGCELLVTFDSRLAREDRVTLLA